MFAGDVGMSLSQMHRILDLVELPQEVLEAFGSTSVLTVKAGVRLKAVLKGHRREVLREARRIAEVQRERRSAGRRLLSAGEVVKRLVAAGEAEQAATVSLGRVRTPSGGVVVGGVFDRSAGWRLDIGLPSLTTDLEEVMGVVRDVMRANWPGDGQG